MKNNSGKEKKDREVGPGGRKFPGDNSLHKKHINSYSISGSGKYSPVLSSCSPTQQHTCIRTHDNIQHHAGEPCGTLACSTRQPNNEAVYGPHKCRSAGVIDNESGCFLQRVSK